MSSVRRRAAVAGLVALPVLVLLSACQDDGSPFGLKGGNAGGGATASAVAPTSGADSPLAAGGGETSATSETLATPDASSDGLAAVGGVWKGTYHCAQGATSMQLALVPNGAAVTGTFEFRTGSTMGAYTLKGTQEGSKVVLHADQWLEQPDGYFLVDFEITSISADRLTGTVDGEGCSTFSVTRD